MVTVSESLKKGIENFLEVTPQVTSHMENSENPHGVTKSQVGLGKVKNEEQATSAELLAHTGNTDNPHAVTKEQIGLSNVKNAEQATKAEFLAEQEKNAAHTASLENPHAVTAAQVGLGNLKNEEQATKEEFSTHTENAKNPHNVTKAQVGLSNVLNEQQATVTQYLQHISGNADRHSGSDIYYSDSKTINEKIEELLIEGGSGTMYHGELLDRDLPSQHPISAIDGLREELDTLEENLSGISHTTLSGRDLPSQHPIEAIDGLSEKLDEVLIFTGITTDGKSTGLTPAVESEFLNSEGSIIIPNGTCMSIEIIITGAREQNGIIADRNVVSFELRGMIAKINAAIVQSLSDTVTRETQTNNGGEMPYKFSFFGNTGKRLTVTGAEGHRVFWRAEVRLKNIVRVSAE